jgi:hypothetical protein
METSGNNSETSVAPPASSKFQRSLSMQRAFADLSKMPSIKKMPSFFIRKTDSVTIDRNPSFFGRFFSSKKLKVAAGDDDSDSSHAEEEDVFQPMHDDDKPSSYNDGIVDPPMPRLGKPINVEALKERNHRAEDGLAALMKMVNREYSASIKDAVTIPVSNELDRVQVSKAASMRMATVNSKAGIHKRVEGNMNEIQKSLNFRKSVIIIMNENYANKIVRKIEPIYVNEARSIINTDVENPS